jgi:hypothetical protein
MTFAGHADPLAVDAVALYPSRVDRKAHGPLKSTVFSAVFNQHLRLPLTTRR